MEKVAPKAVSGKDAMCKCAEAINAAIRECRQKAELIPEQDAVYLSVALELAKVERRHFEECAGCQAAEAAADGRVANA